MVSKIIEDEMIIRLQTLDNCLTLKVRRSASVSELKDKIYESYNIPVDKQRLIFQGKLLKEADKLANNKISDDSVIHLVAKSVVEQPNVESVANENSQIDSNNLESSPTINNIQDTLPNILQFPIVRTNRQRRQRISNFDISECFESLHQNISSIENLKSCKNEFDEKKLEQTHTVIPFDFVKAKYEIGQWVDVKDTIDQWLEAQVIQVRDNVAFVHYNGWGTRWDEWIDFGSTRIAPFRTYTVQSPSSIFSSPHPSVPCDANAQPQERSIDTYFYLEKCSKYMIELNQNLENMMNLRKSSGSSGNLSENREKEIKRKKDDVYSRNLQNTQFNDRELSKNDLNILFQTSQVIPILDRCGRLFSDVSLYLSHTILNPTLCNKLLLEQTKLKDIVENKSIELFQESLNSQIGLNNYSSTSMIENNVPEHNTSENVQHPSNNPSNYNLSHSSSELPFIQRLQNTRGNTNSIFQNIQESWPKINLQVPAIFNSSGMTNSSFGWSNIDIYVQTIVASPISNRINHTNTLDRLNERTISINPGSENPQNGINNEINISNLLENTQRLNANNANDTSEPNNENINRIHSESRLGLINPFFQEKSTQTEFFNQVNNQRNENRYYHQANAYLDHHLVDENSNYEECEDEENSNDLSGDNNDDIDNIINFR